MKLRELFRRKQAEPAPVADAALTDLIATERIAQVRELVANVMPLISMHWPTDAKSMTLLIHYDDGTSMHMDIRPGMTP